jgi:ribosomal protein S18 acetylase RimI-like enzyme
MSISRYPWRDAADIPRILDLVRCMPLACPHVIDLPWRLSALERHAGKEGDDACFWADSDGQVVGFAACQPIWAALDFYLLPGAEAQAAAPELFSWARARFQERKWSYPYWVEFRDDDHERHRMAQARGFTDEEDHYALFEHRLDDLSPAPSLPGGFTLRPLAGEAEAVTYTEAHRAAFNSTAMTAEWRARTIRMPQYRPALDLVVTAPNGAIAGFCVGWLDPARHVAQIEPIGVHPRFQRHGLGRILLFEILRRFREQGASSALVQTDLDRTPARRAYESVGFEQVHTIRGRKQSLTLQR